MSNPIRLNDRAVQLNEAAKLCNKRLDAMAGGPEYRNDTYEALELAKDALEAALSDELARSKNACSYCNGTGDKTKG